MFRHYQNETSSWSQTEIALNCGFCGKCQNIGSLLQFGMKCGNFLRKRDRSFWPVLFLTQLYQCLWSARLTGCWTGECHCLQWLYSFPIAQPVWGGRCRYWLWFSPASLLVLPFIPDHSDYWREDQLLYFTQIPNSVWKSHWLRLISACLHLMKKSFKYIKPFREKLLKKAN